MTGDVYEVVVTQIQTQLPDSAGAPAEVLRVVGGPALVAGTLRAFADELRPPQPVMRRPGEHIRIRDVSDPTGGP